MTYVSHNEFLNIYENKDKYFSSNNDLHSSILDHIQLKYKKKFKLNTTCKAQFPPGDKFARSEKQISAMYLLSEKNSKNLFFTSLRANKFVQWKIVQSVVLQSAEKSWERRWSQTKCYDSKLLGISSPQICCVNYWERTGLQRERAIPRQWIYVYLIMLPIYYLMANLLLFLTTVRIMHEFACCILRSNNNYSSHTTRSTLYLKFYQIFVH